MSEYQYKRVLLKISGEALMGNAEYGIDPDVDEDAVRFDSISYHEVLVRGLQVMDATATALCQDNHMQIIVLNIDGEDTIKRALAGESVGTVVMHEE